MLLPTLSHISKYMVSYGCMPCFSVVKQNLVLLCFGALKLCTLGSVHVNKLLTFSVTHQTTLCVLKA